MPKIRSTWQALSLDPEVLNNLDTLVEQVLIEATETWLFVALDTVPIWSAASHHTFGGVAAIVGVPIVATPVPSAPDRTLLGATSGTGSLSKDADGVWSFEYSTTLDYLIDNETRRTFIKNTPYEFIPMAEEAAVNYIIEVMPRRVPGLLDSSLLVSRIK